jgi:hypothetical protein
MLTVVQFPIADFRRVAGWAEVPPSPSWPPRTWIPAQFVRHFGIACPRFRGVDRAWTDEASYCRADRALRLPKLEQMRCAFRRLLSDGEAVARVEVGLHCDPAELAAARRMPGAASIADVLDLVLQLPTQVPAIAARAAAPEQRALARQGKALGALYLHATSGSGVRPSDLAPSLDRMVAIGAPVAIVEVASGDAPLPRGFREVACSLPPSVRLAFGQHRMPWGDIDAWVVRGGEPREMVRGLRICLLRLHAEQQVLAAVLQRCAGGQIQYVPGSPTADRLEEYLNRATRVIEREQWHDVPQSQILAAFDAFQGDALEAGRRIDLAGRLDAMRRQVRLKVQRFESRSARVINVFDGGIHMENVNETNSITFGDNATVGNAVIARDIRGSFNQQAQMDEVKQLLQELKAAVEQAAQAAPGKNAVLLQQHAGQLAKELAEAKPRREWYEVSVEGLKEAAEAVGEIGKPIVETTRKLLPLLAALWP